MLVRYIKDSLNGSTANTGSHWCRVYPHVSGGSTIAITTAMISVINDSGVSVGYSVYGGGDAGTCLSQSIGLTPYINSNVSNPARSHLFIDLGTTYNLDYISIYHYYDGRTYYNTATYVSSDGVNWTTLFDSAIVGTYIENGAFNTYYLNSYSYAARGSLITTTYFNTLRNLINAYWSSSSGANSNSSMTPTASAVVAGNKIYASDLTNLIIDLKKLNVTASGTSYKLNLMSSYAGPSVGSIMATSAINSALTAYEFINKSCFICVSSTTMCSACNSGCQNGCYSCQANCNVSCYSSFQSGCVTCNGSCQLCNSSCYNCYNIQ